jgi:GH15 family glucan-1,4-alpha-glucosidase
MPARIEDYALIGDCEAAALVSRDGSIDWLCWPRFDSDACFAALLGGPDHGRWRIAPTDPDARISRRYLPDTLVLETTFQTGSGTVSLVDFMPPRGDSSDLVRLAICTSGRVEMQMELILRFGYGATVPWVTRLEDGGLRAIAGPDMVLLRTEAPVRGENMTTVADFTLDANETMPFVLTYSPSHLPLPGSTEPLQALEDTRTFWTEWAATTTIGGPYQREIKRSLLTLKALTYAPTGGLIAAPTTSLPEQFGGPRNWDYRFCWIRDATLTLLGLMNAQHFEEGQAWADWLNRAVAGCPDDMQIMYGIGGERRLLEWEASWLPGYEGSAPVRVGNAAHEQFQLDVYGELMDVFHQGRRAAGRSDPERWPIQATIADHVSKVWMQPDEGIWEVRGGARHFTYSKAMAWVALDRAVRCVEDYGRAGDVEAWRIARDAIKAEVLSLGVDRDRGCFKRAYDDATVDASLLLLAEVGFVRPDDPLFVATVAAIERELMNRDGLVMRYDTRRAADDGLPPGEGAFLPCSFWLANAYVLLGRIDDARRLFERLLGLCNDVGLLSEEYDSSRQRLAGNFPQAFSHVALLTTALNLTHTAKPCEQRSDRGGKGPSMARAGDQPTIKA